MKITYIHQYFNTPKVAGSTRSYEMARRLVKMGHEVNMVTSRRDLDVGHQWEKTNEDGINVNWIPVRYSNNMGFYERIRAFILFAFHASRKSAEIPADVVLATSTPLTIALPAVFAKWRKKIPLVLEIRDLWPEVPIALGIIKSPILIFAAKLLERFAYANSDHIVALSPDMADGIRAVCGGQKPISIIPNGSDPFMSDADSRLVRAFRSKLGLCPDTKLMVYAGTFGLVNGVGYLVKLASAMKEDGRFHILLVGEGAEKHSVIQQAKALGVLGVNLTVADYIAKKDMPTILCSADIVVSTVIPVSALEANSANKVFDGMAAGRCIAVNHGGWLADIIANNEAGMVLSKNASDAAFELRRWLDEPIRFERANEQAKLLGTTMFSRDDLARDLSQVLAEVAAEA